MNHTIAWQLASRYLRGKRSANAVPVLSRISMLAIAVGSCALIVLFSVFNGFENVVQDLYKAFYPDIRITAAKGKFFEPPAKANASLMQMPGIAFTSRVIEDNVLVNGNDEQIVVTLKGVDPAYFHVNDLSQYIAEGVDTVSSVPTATAIIGQQIEEQLGTDVHNAFNDLSLYYPDANSENLVQNPQSAFRTLRLRPEGVFHIQDDFDSKYVLAPLPFAEELFDENGHVSAIEIKLKPGTNAEELKRNIQAAFGSSYKVETRFEQNRTLYMVMRTEKWAVYAILLMVLLIASFNMVGALSLLVLEKRKDMAILRAMGAEGATIRSIFLLEGMLWAFTGGALGLIAGTLLCLGQQHFQWIKLGGSFIITAYPVAMQPTDFIVVICTVLVVGMLAGWYPAKRAKQTDMGNLRSA
ncbi:FtsX-like permease family protein [Chitinophagaceae bacterium MMS25-I14]